MGPLAATARIRHSPGVRFRWVKAPTCAELTQLAATIAHRTARFLERQGLLERDAEQAYCTSDCDKGSMDGLIEPAITYRIAVGPHQGRKVMTLQTLAPDDPFESGAGQVAGFSLHAGVAARAHERAKLERLCRYISRPPGRRTPVVAHRPWQYPLSPENTVPGRHALIVTQQRLLSLRENRPYCLAGATHVIFEPLDFIAKLAALAPAKPVWRFASLSSKKPCRSARPPPEGQCHPLSWGLCTQQPDSSPDHTARAALCGPSA